MKNFKRTKFPFWYMIGLAFIMIFDALVIILTLAQFTSQYQLQYVFWYHKRKHLKNKVITKN